MNFVFVMSSVGTNDRQEVTQYRETDKRVVGLSEEGVSMESWDKENNKHGFRIHDNNMSLSVCWFAHYEQQASSHFIMKIKSVSVSVMTSHCFTWRKVPGCGRSSPAQTFDPSRASGQALQPKSLHRVRARGQPPLGAHRHLSVVSRRPRHHWRGRQSLLLTGPMITWLRVWLHLNTCSCSNDTCGWQQLQAEVEPQTVWSFSFGNSSAGQKNTLSCLFTFRFQLSAVCKLHTWSSGLNFDWHESTTWSRLFRYLSLPELTWARACEGRQVSAAEPQSNFYSSPYIQSLGTLPDYFHFM